MSNVVQRAEETLGDRQSLVDIQNHVVRMLFQKSWGVTSQNNRGKKKKYSAVLIILMQSKAQQMSKLEQIHPPPMDFLQSSTFHP